MRPQRAYKLALVRCMSPIRRMLEHRAAEPIGDQVYVHGGWVDRCSTVPTAGGVEYVVRFADACWRENIGLQRQLLEAHYEYEALRARLQPLKSREDMADGRPA